MDDIAKIKVQDTEISVIKSDNRDYISLTDMAGAKGNMSRAADVIKNWLRNRYTIESLGVWEIIHNPDFKVVEFDHSRKQAGFHLLCLAVATGLKALMPSESLSEKVVMEVHTRIRISLLNLGQPSVFHLSCISSKSFND